MSTNVKAVVKGTTLTITVDLSKEFGTSASGKNTKIATSGGGRGVEIEVPKDISADGTVAVSLNVYKRV